MASLPIHFSAKAKRTREQPISYLITIAKANPQLISFAAGLVDPTTLPHAETLAITQRLLSDPARARVIRTRPGRKGVLEHVEFEVRTKFVDQLPERLAVYNCEAWQK